MFGVFPPHIEGVLTYDELLAAAAAGKVATVQTAVQHDTVIATTPHGSRWACHVKDEDVPGLVADAMRDDSSVPFEVLPIDPVKQKVREVWFNYVTLFGALYVADQLDMLPFDTSTYSSLAEREEAQEAKQRGEAPPRRKALKELMRSVAAKVKSVGAASDASPRATPRIETDEALRRVLGMSQWDASAERRAAAASELRAKAASDAGKLASHVVESEAHQKVVAAHEEYLVKPVAGAKAAIATEIAKAVPWVTPMTLERPLEELPTLEELYARPWRVATIDGVAQYISVQRVRAGPVLRLRKSDLSIVIAKPPPGETAAAGPAIRVVKSNRDQVKAGAVESSAELGASLPITSKKVPWTELLPSLQLLEAGASSVPNYSKRACDDCRYCPEFSALYGHKVYICKRLEGVAELA